MLGGEGFGGAHHGCLVVIEGGDEGADEGDGGFAATDISLEHAHHGDWGLEVLDHVLDGLGLVVGEWVGKVGDNFF